VARLHGGELTLEDNAPGLRVVIALPRSAAAVPAAATHDGDRREPFFGKDHVPT